MKKLYVFVWMVVFFACRKADQSFFSVSSDIQIDSVSITGLSGINFSIRTDTIPNTIMNTVRLPYKSTTGSIELRLHTQKVSKLILLFHASDGSLQQREYVPENDQVICPVEYIKPLTIIAYAGNYSHTYQLLLKTNELPDPEFREISYVHNPGRTTPLAGIFNIRASQAVSITCTVKGTAEGEDVITNAVSDDNGELSVKVLGLYANSNNTVQLTITNREGDQSSVTRYIQTDPLPAYLPDSTDITANVIDATAATRFVLCYPYKTTGSPFYSPGNNGYPMVVDRHGKIRWYMTNPFVLDMKPMPNGHFLQYYYNYVFREVDLLGNIYNEFTPPNPCHHDFVLLPNGNIVYTGTDASLNNTQEDKIYEISPKNGALIRMINLYNILDPSRPQQPFIATAPDDWFHNNSIAYDAADNSLLVTGRHQSTICKIDYTSGTLSWIIAAPDYWKKPLSDYLLNPVGNNFEYTWGQHSAVINPADHNRFMVFDNGNGRSYSAPLQPEQSYSRLVEYSVDPDGHTVEQVFSFGKQYGSENYSPALGNVDYSGNNLFVCFPLINKNASGQAAELSGTPSFRFMETDRSGKVTLDIRVRKGDGTGSNGYRTYRGHPFRF
jgi:hypothetical protein